jgi:hypothetical protein
MLWHIVLNCSSELISSSFFVVHFFLISLECLCLTTHLILTFDKMIAFVSEN